ncbi:MAG: cell division protein FtsQ/DivIB [Blautia sp.]|nr:cell division protein FtsQ/DivIB [Blautia sp.]MCM1201591.1 cell division protein FtsQ/DivIB [Bacteroides fragilis]
MSSRKAVKKLNKKNPYLRLVKGGAKKGKQKEQPEQKLRFGRAKRIIILSVSLFLLFILLVSGYIYIVENYTVTTVYVEGNVHYTNEEIMAMVMDGRYGNNSIFLSLKYRDKGMEDIPFIQTMDVSVEARDTIRIKVYEKAVAGYVAYLGRYIYFDRDGIVVETSEESTPGIPQVTGLSFSHVILHEPLPVENQEVFEDILNITQLLEKYSLPVDKIYFSSDYQVTLIFGDARVAMGPGEDIDEKIMELQYMLPSLEGKSGTLDMREYTEDTRMISFEPD